MKRRTFIHAAGASLLPQTLFAAAPAPGFQIGVTDWNLRLRGDPAAHKLAAELGLDGVQVSFGEPDAPFDLRKPENRTAQLDAAKQHGTRVASLGMGILNKAPYKSDPRTEEWVLDSIPVAKAMGVKVVLLAFFGKGDLKDDPAGTAEVIRRLKLVAPVAEKAGITFGIESMLSAEEHLHIIDAVGSPAVQVYYDVGNSLRKGYDIYREIRELGRERICEFHAKDPAHKLFGQGQVDFWEVRRAMDDIGYRGWIQIEGRTPFGLNDSYIHNRAFLKGLFPEAPAR